MNKLLPGLILLSINAFSQRVTEDFKITLPDQKIHGSLYKIIKFIDSRYDTSNYGIVQLGAFNRKARVVPEIPVSLQLSLVLDALTDSSAADGELLLQVNQFNFAEVTGAMSERGYCYVRATLYALDGEKYRRLDKIDTVALIKSMDVTRALFRNGSKLVSNFISQNLLKLPADLVNYSYNEVVKMDEIEKSKIKIYQTSSFTDGIYLSYSSFRNQEPDKPVVAEIKSGSIIPSIKMTDESGKLIKVKSKDIYAFVYKGQPFMSTDYGYYKLDKKENDFYFTGKAKTSAKTGDVIAASLFFGIIGGLIASGTADATFDMKIDYVNGGFIRLREIKN